MINQFKHETEVKRERKLRARDRTLKRSWNSNNQTVKKKTYSTKANMLERKKKRKSKEQKEKKNKAVQKRNNPECLNFNRIT